MIWINKYSPKLNEIPHQNEIQQIIKTLKSKTPVLIHGPPGTGKTTAATKIAEELNYELLEINASDKRNKHEIEKLIGNAAGQMSLFGKEKLILIDEIDGLSGTQDRGGIQALSKILEKTHSNIIITCNEITNEKLKTIKKKCKIIEFRSLNTKSASDILKSIAEKENIEHDDITLQSLARRTGGDIRAAITDLQTHSAIKNKLNLAHLHDRNPKDEIKNALTIIFKSKDFNLTSQALANLDLNLDDCFLWLEYNMPKEYTKIKDIKGASEKLSKADIFRSRITRRQYFRFLIYQNILMTSGIALSKEEKYTSKPSYKQSSRLLRTWMANQKNHKKKLIAEKISKHTHCSVRHAVKTYDEYKKFLICNSIIKQLELSNDEISYLKK